MRYSTQIKPISYVKAHAAELLDRIAEEREPIIITQNGEARAVLMDVHSYEEMQETMALLQILAIGDKEIARGKTYTLEDVRKDIRARRLRLGPAKSTVASSAAPQHRVSRKKTLK
ncbi:MAG: type II toxin-antitoxin system Phd/YefM family antitoxin [Terracidiphilus sp.]|jgi:prevent-host-death family protein